MHTAGDLTGCKQAGDGGAVSLQHLGGTVDGHAAHGVVHTGGDLDGVEGAVVQGVGKAGAAKVGVVLGLHGGVDLVHVQLLYDRYDPEQFKTYQVPDEFMRVYKTLSTATEMMKNTWKRVLKNNQSYLSDPEKQKVLRFAKQRPALYLNELEACMEQILAETLEEAEKTA